tara:strand:- start:330 stop:1010 length:681 start_codon:yes stop_codon:yes gene_type:complete
MATKIKLLILIFLISPILSFSQKEKKNSVRKQSHIDSKTQILELKNGVLLVRLKAKKRTLEAMRKAKKYKLADKTENKLKYRNQLIINGFRLKFDFCPVYFFYSNDSRHVLTNNLDSISFLNDNLQIDNSIIVKANHIYIAEFGNIEPSKTPNYQTTVSLLDKEKRNTFNGSSDFSFKVLCIKNNNFDQLSNPFPYYVKESKGLPLKGAIESAIQSMNSKLNNYYK